MTKIKFLKNFQEGVTAFKKDQIVTLELRGNRYYYENTDISKENFKKILR